MATPTITDTKKQEDNSHQVTGEATAVVGSVTVPLNQWKALINFALGVSANCWEGGVDWGDIQEIAAGLGVWTEHVATDTDRIPDTEPGDTYFKLAAWVTADPSHSGTGSVLEDNLTSSSELSRLRTALEEAYGLLWTMEVDTRTRSGWAASTARKILLAQTDKAGQARGITFARGVLPEAPWRDCPSTHCERRGECASPNECIVGERAREALTSTPLEKTDG